MNLEVKHVLYRSSIKQRIWRFITPVETSNFVFNLWMEARQQRGSITGKRFCHTNKIIC